MRPLALTMGDPAGIGGEITLMTWRDQHENLPAFATFDDPDRLTRLAEATGITCPIQVINELSDAESVLSLIHI